MSVADHCGLGVCAAIAGHEGTCDEASGWVEDAPPCNHGAYYGGTDGNPAKCLVCPSSSADTLPLAPR